MQITLRRELPADHRAVEELTRAAFWDLYVPGCDEHYLAHILRDAACFLPDLDLVATVDGRLVGNIMYTLARLVDIGGLERQVLSFGPVCVAPEYQGRGIGGALIQKSLDIARGLGYGAVLIYGDPAYYCRFGFQAAEERGILGRGGLHSPALQALELFPGALKGVQGTFLEDDVYDVDPAAAAEFDQGFPPRDKGFRPSQLRYQELLAQAHY